MPKKKRKKAIKVKREPKQSKTACCTTAIMIVTTVISLKMYFDKSYRKKLEDQIRIHCNKDCLANGEIGFQHA